MAFGHHHLVRLEGSLDGVRLVVHPFELFQSPTLGFDPEEVPRGGLDAVPSDENVRVFVADIPEGDGSGELIDEPDTCYSIAE